jgi:cytochrome c-type biogenesis protein CcmF
MIPELGHFALILAALVALILGTLPLLGAHQNRLAWVAVARPAATVMALLITFSFACLVQAFVTNDFSVVYVAQHSNSLLPIQYRVAAVWGATKAPCCCGCCS